MDRAEFDRHAEAYEREHAANIAVTGEAPEYFSEYKIADAHRKCGAIGMEPTRILDFGAGIGNSTPFFRRYFPSAALSAADVSAKSLEILERRHPGEVERIAIQEKIQADDNSFDLSFTACVFHHIPADEHIHWLSDIHRVTRPSGLFVLFEHNPYNPLTVHAVNTCPFDDNAVLIKAQTMKQRMLAAGWSDICVQYRIFFPNLFAFARPTERFLTWLPLGGQYCVFARR